MIIPVLTSLRQSFLSIVLAVIMAFSPCAHADSNTQDTILVLGDSLSGAYGIDTNKGWVALLHKEITRKGYDYQVINASVSGDTTRTGLGRITRALNTHNPDIVIIALGGNDGLRGLALSEIESSLAAIVERSQDHGADVLLVGVRLPPNYGAAYIQRFATLYRNLAKRYQIPLVPRMLDDVAEHRELLQEDGIHPGVTAQPQIMKNIWAELEPMLEKQ